MALSILLDLIGYCYFTEQKWPYKFITNVSLYPCTQYKAKYCSAVSALAKCCLSFITKVLLTKFITYTTATNIQLNKGFRHNILKKSILSIKTCKAIQVGPVMLRSTQ